MPEVRICHVFSCFLAGFFLACSHNPKYDQYLAQGQDLYLKHCSNCHQADGTGLALLFPPVDRSDFVDKNFEKVICGIKYGMTGELMVNGKKFNQPMPGAPLLSDLEVAEIATYLYNSWGRQRGLVDAKEVTPIINECQ